jgi:hypothetical protein
VEKAIKEMRDKKATGYYEAPGDVVQMLGESGLRIVTKLINNIYETAVTFIAIKKKPRATKCSDHYTFSLIAHTATLVERILRGRIERVIQEVLGEGQFGFRRGN